MLSWNHDGRIRSCANSVTAVGSLAVVDVPANTEVSQVSRPSEGGFTSTTDRAHRGACFVYLTPFLFRAATLIFFVLGETTYFLSFAVGGRFDTDAKIWSTHRRIFFLCPPWTRRCFTFFMATFMRLLCREIWRDRICVSLFFSQRIYHGSFLNYSLSQAYERKHDAFSTKNGFETRSRRVSHPARGLESWPSLPFRRPHLTVGSSYCALFAPCVAQGSPEHLPSCLRSFLHRQPTGETHAQQQETLFCFQLSGNTHLRLPYLSRAYLTSPPSRFLSRRFFPWPLLFPLFSWG